MTGRSVAEWIGATPDAKVPPRVRARNFLAYDGRCHKTGRKIGPADAWETDHIVAIINGGENRESNLAPILAGKPHREKTAEDVALKSKTARIRNRHIGIRPKSKFAGGRDSKWKKKISGEVVFR